MGTPPPPSELVSRLPARETLVARDAETTEIAALLAESPSALVLEGVPGIGKTTLWEHGAVLAEQQGLRVLAARASGAETGLPFAALIDLLDGVAAEELTAIPGPQRRALEVALYREDPGDRPPEPHAIALGLLAALRLLSAERRLVVAIDDIQWLDPTSEEALAYAVRRLGAEPVTFLLARRPGPRSTLEQAFADGRLRRLPVGAISLGATRQVLASRLGLRLPHHLLRRVYDTTLGNPLFALEVGRVLATRDLESLGDDVPVPGHVEDLLGLRVGDLADPVRHVLLALALDADLRTDQLRELAGSDPVDQAVKEGIVTIDGDRPRPSHPLLAATAKEHATSREKQQLHRALADVVTSEERRALHLAMATDEEDEQLAGRVSAAADQAAARGANRLAVVLGSHALRLTPDESSAHSARVIDLGCHLSIAGEKELLTELIEPRAETLPTSEDRAKAFLLLAKGVVRDNEHIRALMERALDEAGKASWMRVTVLAELAENEAAIDVARLPRAAARAEEAARGLPASLEAERLVLSALAWTRALSGRPVLDLADRYHALPDDRYFLSRSPRRVAAQRMVWRGEIESAREVLTALKAQSEERAEPSSYALVRLHLCELALKIGDWAEARRLLADWAASDDDKLLHWPMFERCQALLAAGLGDRDGTRTWAHAALERADETGTRWDWLEAHRALGLAAVLDKDLTAATQHFDTVWKHTESEGVGDPGVFPVAPDLVEALVEGEQSDRARAVVARLGQVAEEHPWAATAFRRGTALTRLADDGYGDDAAAELEAVASTYAEMGLRFDEARTLLALGRAQRRARKWGAARDTLERASGAFDDLGSPGWAADARAELDRVGARRPTSDGGLTTTEQRVAGLAAEGLSNKQIARTLVVTVNTVEFHLRNVYAKLGIRSRAQLAAALADESVEPDA